MVTKGAHHVSFTVRDLESSREFYGEVLGLPEVERPDLGIPGAWYRAGAVQIHLIGVDEDFENGTPADKISPIANHLAFEVEDYDAAKSRLEARGFETLALGTRAGQFWVKDPQGNVIEFIRPAEPTPS